MLLVLALGSGVHDDLVVLVADAVLRAPLRVQLEVGHVERVVGLEGDLAEAEGVALAISAGIRGIDADELVAVLDVDVDAVLMEAALAVLECRVAGQCHRCDVRVPLDGDRLEIAGSRTNITSVANGAFRRREDFVAVSGADVDLAAVLVAHEGLQVIVLVLGLPAVGGADRGVHRLGETDRCALHEADLAGATGGLSHRSSRCYLVLVTEESHGNSFHSA